jgi:cytochrome P450
MISLLLLLPVVGALAIIASVYFKSLALKDVPGPFLTRFTKIPLLYQTINLNRTRYIHALHRKYGPVVRLAPDEISLNHPPSVGPIYNYEKSHFYNAFEAYGAKNMFSTPDRARHSGRRKHLGGEYTKVYMLKPENLTVIYDRVRQMINTISDNSTVDVFYLFNYLAQDIISGFFFGNQYGSHLLQGQDTEVFHAWHMRRQTFHWFAELPNLTKLLYASGIANLIPGWKDAAKGEQFINDMTHKWMDACDPEKAHLLTKLMKTTNLSREEYSAEVMDHMGAGHETTGTTLTFLIDHLSKNPSQQQKLHQELQTVDLTDFAAVDKLPYLHGVVLETLRLYSSIPASEPRIVPPEGVTLLDKYAIPASTVISAQPYSMHRQEEYFERCLEFLPERWDKPTAKARTAWMAFGKGTRGCIGQNIAMVTIKVAVSHLYKSFETGKPVPLPEGEDMDWKDYYMITPKADTCSVVFRRVGVDDGEKE